MHFGLMLLLCSSGALGAGLRRPRQLIRDDSSSGSSAPQGGGQQGGGNPFNQFTSFMPTQVTQSFMNPNELIMQQQNQLAGGFGNQLPTNQIPPGFNPIQQQQQQQQQQQPTQQAFFNRNPPQQQVFFANRNPPNPNEPIPIISYENIQPGDGTYKYSYETGDGIRKEESGEQRVVGEPPEAGTAARGSYSYTDLEGNQIAVTYTADENGFQPSGAHLPTPPPIPRDIMAALEQSAQAEAAQNNGVISPAYHYFFKNFRRI